MSTFSYLQPNLMTTEDLRNHLKLVSILCWYFHATTTDFDVFYRDFPIKMCQACRVKNCWSYFLCMQYQSHGEPHQMMLTWNPLLNQVWREKMRTNDPEINWSQHQQLKLLQMHAKKFDWLTLNELAINDKAIQHQWYGKHYIFFLDWNKFLILKPKLIFFLFIYFHLQESDDNQTSVESKRKKITWP